MNCWHLLPFAARFEHTMSLPVAFRPPQGCLVISLHIVGNDVVGKCSGFASLASVRDLGVGNAGTENACCGMDKGVPVGWSFNLGSMATRERQRLEIRCGGSLLVVYLLVRPCYL